MLRRGFEEDTLTAPSIVIDNGSGVMKAGYAGIETPKHVFPSFVGRVKHVRAMAGALEGDVFIGNKADEYRGLLILNYPMEHGVVTNWGDMELIWSHIYSELKALSEEHPVLLTEAPLNPRVNRRKTAEVFFESFGCPSLFMSAQAILALYATGRTTGVVLDSGDGVTHVVPVFEGFALSHAIGRSDIAGRSVSGYLSLLMRRAGYVFHTSAEMQAVKEIKESTCHVLFEPQSIQSQRLVTAEVRTPEASYILPDGSLIKIQKERYLAPEILFNPLHAGSEYPGVHQLLVNAINKADLDLRKTFYSQIVLSGGSTFFPGFGERLLNEVRKTAPKDNTVNTSNF